MATHRLFHGGQRTGNSLGPTPIFPATEPDLTDRMDLDAQKSGIDFGLTRVLDFEAGSLVQNASIPAGLSPESWATSRGLRHYMRENAIVNNDVIVTHILPKFSRLLGVHWAVQKAITPFTFTLRVRGQANSIGGVVNLKTGISGASVGSGFIDCHGLTAAGLVDVSGDPETDVAVAVSLTSTPLYFDENDALELVITAAPAADTNPDGSQSGGIIGAAVWITPVIQQFIRGI